MHRPADQIGGEVEWVNYLADAGLSVCRAVPSAAGNVTEKVKADEGYFTAVAFEEAGGTHTLDEQWKPGLFVKMGQMMGRMHALTGEYTPRESSFYRPSWDQEATGFAERFLPATERVAIDKYNSLLDRTRALERESYGLVHLDFHRDNFFIENGEIRIFDFDDCQYSWFADDIAVALFYAVPHDCRKREDLDFARSFMRYFLAGYQQENRIDSMWVERIPMFLKRREFAIYIIGSSPKELSDHKDPRGQGFKESSEKHRNIGTL